MNLIPRNKKRARFPDDPPEIDYQTVLQVVENICEPLTCSHEEQRDCLEFILDQERKLWEIDTRKEVTRIEIKQNCVSLDKILQSPGQMQAIKPPKRERLSLAVNLAYSVLQLHTTPWLPEKWGIESIYIPFDLQQPHVVVKFDEPTRLLENPVDIVNPYLVALGIVLLELWEWKSFQQWTNGRGDLKFRMESLIDVAGAALKWLEEWEDQRKMSTSYAQVVRRCLNCSFNPMQRTLTDEEFQDAVYRDIVQTLDTVYEAYTNPLERLMMG